MTEPMLPRAERRYRKRNKHGYVSTRTAHFALVLTHGAGYVIVSRRGQSGISHAAKAAKAWNAMVSAAESRHESFWARHDKRIGA